MSIEVRHISKTFGRFAALDDVSLRINQGQLVALLGPSGSGKTTLLRIIAGLEAPDENPQSAVLFENEDVTSRSAQNRRVGFVFQHYALFRHMSVFENVAFGLRVKRRSERPSKPQIAKQVHDLLRLVQLDGLADRYPDQLSGGQRQRVALARALAVQPRVLLLDEPFGALDARVRQELRQWLRRLHDELSMTSVFVTHDQEEALEVADVVVLMNEGRIIQADSPERVFHEPANEFVMNFLGSVNVFHGRVQDGKALLGPLQLECADHHSPQSLTARALVRPYDLDVHEESNGRPSFRAVVQHVNAAGPRVKVSLKAETGLPVQVEMSMERYRNLDLSAGRAVFVSVRDLRLFVDAEHGPSTEYEANNYSI